jgi:hypothetical protein
MVTAKNVSQREQKICRLTETALTIINEQQREMVKMNKRMELLEKEITKLKTISSKTINNNTKKEGQQRMTYNKAAAKAMDDISLLATDQQKEASKVFLITGRNPTNNQPVIAKAPMAARLQMQITGAEQIENPVLKEKINNLRWVYAQGLARVPFNQMRRALAMQNVNTGGIANIRFCTNNVTEFICQNEVIYDELKEALSAMNAKILQDDYPSWDAVRMDMDKEEAQRIAIFNIARTASSHRDLAIGLAYQFRLPVRLQEAFKKELGKFIDGKKKDNQVGRAQGGRSAEQK